MISLSRKRKNQNYFRLFSILILTIIFLGTPILTSCASKKPRVVTTKKQRDKRGGTNDRSPVKRDRITETVNPEPTDSTNEITIENQAIAAARTFLGTKWKYAGNDERGMDCSGLICTSYKAAGVTVPRTTGTLKEATVEIEIDEVKDGDLIFFATGSNKNRLNHVGMVVNVTPAEIQFIHASTSRGVIISSLNEPFWLGSYLSVGRL